MMFLKAKGGPSACFNVLTAVMMAFQNYLLVGAGGAVGACLRLFIVQSATRLAGHGFPVGTMTVNIVGSFLMGVLITWLAFKMPEGQASLRVFLATGLLGGFTTFSAFSLDAQTLLERGAYGQAGFYIAGSVLLALTAILLGIWIGRAIWG